MNKKKLPIVLIVVVVTLIGVSAVMNGAGMSFGREEHSANDGHGHESEEPINASSATDAQVEDASAMLKQASGSGETVDSPKMRAPGAVDPENAGPYQASILLPKHERHDPIINESATSSQWYEDDSMQKKLADEKAKEAAAISGGN